MTQQMQHATGPRRRRARSGWARPDTVPAIPPTRTVADDDPTLLGFPADVEDDSDADRVGADAEVGMAVLRRADRLGCAALVVAGGAANVSLSLPWFPGEGTAGLSLVSRAADLLGTGLGPLAASDVWPPFVVVVGGGLLVVLGLLLLVPAHSHRAVGVLALLVAAATAAAVVVLLAGAGWRLGRVGPGAWCAIVVPLFGVLGALKAMLTAPRVVLVPR